MKEKADLLVFAPHPDDETLGCGGVMRRAMAEGKRVHVVMITNGDGFPEAVSAMRKKDQNKLVSEDYLEFARVRQVDVLAALEKLGLAPEDVSFLGYPDSILEAIYKSESDVPLQLPFTMKLESYSMIGPDYHTAVCGRPGRYVKEDVLFDFRHLIERVRPDEIYVTDEADDHGDHQAAYWFVRDAARAAAYTGKIFTYLVHSGPEAEWPWPHGSTPKSEYDIHQYEGERIPHRISWPPDRRVSLAEAEMKRKREAIEVFCKPFQSELELAYLRSFIKSEEIFWRRA